MQPEKGHQGVFINPKGSDQVNLNIFIYIGNEFYTGLSAEGNEQLGCVENLDMCCAER